MKSTGQLSQGADPFFFAWRWGYTEGYTEGYLKVERIHQRRYETRAQARLDIVDWIEGLRISAHRGRRFNLMVDAISA